jgi:hypothetical protein
MEPIAMKTIRDFAIVGTVVSVVSIANAGEPQPQAPAQPNESATLTDRESDSSLELLPKRLVEKLTRLGLTNIPEELAANVSRVFDNGGVLVGSVDTGIEYETSSIEVERVVAFGNQSPSIDEWDSQGNPRKMVVHVWKDEAVKRFFVSVFLPTYDSTTASGIIRISETKNQEGEKSRRTLVLNRIE